MKPTGSRPPFPFPWSALHPADGRKRLARPQRCSRIQKGGLQTVRLQRARLCRCALVQVQEFMSCNLLVWALNVGWHWTLGHLYLLQGSSEAGTEEYNIRDGRDVQGDFHCGAGQNPAEVHPWNLTEWCAQVEQWRQTEKLPKHSMFCVFVTDLWQGDKLHGVMWLCSVSSPGVLQGFELRLLTETEILWTTLCLTAASGRWAVGYFTYATLPLRQPPRPSPSLKWSQMRWRVASLCRGMQEANNRKPDMKNPAVTTSTSMSLWSLFFYSGQALI